MACDVGRLCAHLDNALSAADEAALGQHLAVCPRCREALAALEARSRATDTRLDLLEPAKEAVPDAAGALSAFRTRASSAHTVPGLNDFLRSIPMTLSGLAAPRRRAILAAAAVTVLALVFVTVAPARQAAADFLSVFRVRKFAIIPVDPSQVDRLEKLGESLDENTFGREEILREPGEPQTVASAAEASALAGFAVRVPQTLPQGASLKALTVQTGPHIRYTAQRAALQAFLNTAGIQDATLPEAEELVFEVNVPTAVTLEYIIDGSELNLTQVRDPEVSLPADVDPAVLGEFGLQLLGIPPEDAKRLAASIDWATTLVIPLPTDAGSSREVTVDGVSGLLLEESPREDQPRGSRVVIWERDGVVYAAEGHRIDPLVLIQIADSLR